MSSAAPVRDSIDNKKEIIRRIRAIDNLPTLPHVVTKMNQLLRSPRSTAAEVGELLGSDQVLAARTLKLVNSPYYGFGGKINSISRAIVILGFNRVRNLALSVSVLDIFRKSKSRTFDFQGFWRHSIATGVMCETIAEHTRSDDVEDALVAGLLHDIGKLVLGVFFKDEYRRVIKHVSKTGEYCHDVEMDQLGLDHGEIGGLIAAAWNLPDKLNRSIAFHNTPARTRHDQELVYLVHVSQFLCTAMLAGNSWDVRLPPVNERVWKHYDFSGDDIDAILSKFSENLKPALEFFQLGS